MKHTSLAEIYIRKVSECWLVDYFLSNSDRILIGQYFIGWNLLKANCKNSSMFPIGWFNSRICFENRFFIAGHGGIRTSNSSKYQDSFQILGSSFDWPRVNWRFWLATSLNLKTWLRFDEITICIISIDVSVSVNFSNFYGYFKVCNKNFTQ